MIKDEPNIGDIWLIGYIPTRCSVCGEFAGYKPITDKHPAICSFKCAAEYHVVHPDYHAEVVEKHRG